MSFAMRKTWDDRRTCARNQCIRGRTWVRRIQWLEDATGRVKLKLEDGATYREVIAAWPAAAQTVWDRFRDGQSIGDAVSILASQVSKADASRRATH